MPDVSMRPASLSSVAALLTRLSASAGRDRDGSVTGGKSTFEHPAANETGLQ
jgi:hypothetical protein